jgi:hypothetical protein
MTSDSISFDVTIGPSCDDDAIFYQQDVKSQFDGSYFLGVNEASELALSPQLANSVPNCPITCELTSTDEFDPIFDFDDTNGDLVVKTMLASLDGRTYSYAIECISELSLVQTTPEVQSFDILF